MSLTKFLVLFIYTVVGIFFQKTYNVHIVCFEFLNKRNLMFGKIDFKGFCVARPKVQKIECMWKNDFIVQRYKVSIIQGTLNYFFNWSGLWIA